MRLQQSNLPVSPPLKVNPGRSGDARQRLPVFSRLLTAPLNESPNLGAQTARPRRAITGCL